MIDRTFDYRKVCKLAPWKPIISREIIYLIEDDIGLWSFNKYLDGVLIHADMTRNCRGRRAVESAKSAFKWIFNNTDHEKIYAKIHVDKKAASCIAISSGMEFMHENDEHRFYEVKK